MRSIREKSQQESEKRPARAQARHLAQRRLGQEGDEPQAGDCHWARLKRDAPVRRSPPRRRDEKNPPAARRRALAELRRSQEEQRRPEEEVIDGAAGASRHQALASQAFSAPASAAGSGAVACVIEPWRARHSAPRQARLALTAGSSHRSSCPLRCPFSVSFKPSGVSVTMYALRLMRISRFKRLLEKRGHQNDPRAPAQPSARRDDAVSSLRHGIIWLLTAQPSAARGRSARDRPPSALARNTDFALRPGSNVPYAEESPAARPYRAPHHRSQDPSPAKSDARTGTGRFQYAPSCS